MKTKLPPGPVVSFARFMLGQMFPSRYPFDQLALNLEARGFGDIAHYQLGPIRVYQLNHPDLIQQVLIEQSDRFQKPDLLKNRLRPALGTGLVTSDGALWKKQRTLMQPPFRHDRVAAAYGEVIAECAEQTIQSFSEAEVRNVDDDMQSLSLAIIVKSLFGGDLSGDAAEIGSSLVAVVEEASERMNSGLRLPSRIPTRSNVRERQVLARFDAIMQSLISARRHLAESRDDVLSILLAAIDGDTGAPISDRQVRDEMATLFFAGRSTTANALTWTWYLLSRHPEAEAKLQDELQHRLGGRTPRAADLPQLPYTAMVVREAMRLFPPAPAFARQPAEDVVIGGYEIPKGSLVTVSTYAIHHDGRFFPQPEEFVPDRFAAGWERRTPGCAYLPFGAGPRMCIGSEFAMAETRLVLATIAQRCRLRLEPNVEIKPKQLLSLKPSVPVRMRVQMRAIARGA
jgi:cytochrome P450